MIDQQPLEVTSPELGSAGELPTAIGVRPVVRIRGEKTESLDDVLVVEEPLEIRVNNERFTVTMRTPGNDLVIATMRSRGSAKTTSRQLS